MAGAIEKKFGVKPKLVKSGGGVFEVTVNGNNIFSKKASGRFPSNEEIFESIEKIKK